MTQSWYIFKITINANLIKDFLSMLRLHDVLTHAWSHSIRQQMSSFFFLVPCGQQQAIFIKKQFYRRSRLVSGNLSLFNGYFVHCWQAQSQKLQSSFSPFDYIAWYNYFDYIAWYNYAPNKRGNQCRHTSCVAKHLKWIEKSTQQIEVASYCDTFPGLPLPQPLCPSPHSALPCGHKAFSWVLRILRWRGCPWEWNKVG